MRTLLLLLMIAAAMIASQRPGFSQSSTATLMGSVADPSSAVIPTADVTLTNTATGDVRKAESNDRGEFSFVGLLPGGYTLVVSHSGFQQYKADGLTLDVGDRKTIPVVLTLGSDNQTVIVNADQTLLSTESSVSTVIQSKFIQQLPLNGRSFQDLILLIPGTNTNSPQAPSSNNGQSGQLSVNGQGYTSNGYTVDGVSANVNAGNTGGFTSLALGGGSPSSTALGTTQSLVSVDALQEFRVETSSYGAEYGRYPGAQISLTTRSGTSELHGSAYDYFRNDALDANDYFNNYNGVARQPLRQNDFGGTLGGPIFIPRFYNNRKSTFFFFNYEGLRLKQPIAAYPAYVPNATLRASAGSTPLGALLNAFPLPNGPDLGNGLGTFTSGYSAPSSIDSESARLDHSFSDSEKFFYRFSNTPSSSNSTFLAGQQSNVQNNRSNTVGLTSVLSARATNEFRANFTSNEGILDKSYLPQAGAIPTNVLQQLGYGSSTNVYAVGLTLQFAQSSNISISQGRDAARGVNITDAFTVTQGHHSYKLGVDFRRLTSTNLAASPNAGYSYYSGNSVAANQFDYAYLYSFADSFPAYINFSAFAEDEWQISPRLHLSYGIRWDLNPSPSSRRGPLPYSYLNQNNLANLQLAPAGTPIYDTSYYNFAPRVGLSYTANDQPGHETIVRGGTGIFYDTISDEYDILANFVGPGFSAGSSFCPESYCTGHLASYDLPVPLQYRAPAIVYPPVAPYGGFTAYPLAPHVALPYSIQYNTALQQNFGANNAVTISYVGSLGRKLIGSNTSYIEPFNPNFNYVLVASNRLRSAYNAMQLQFQHQQSHGLGIFGGYTWARAIGQIQTNTYLPYRTANTPGDIRNNANLAITYDIPGHFNHKALETVAGGWGSDLRFSVRGGFPLFLTGAPSASPLAGGGTIATALDFVPGQSIYTDINPANNKPVPGGRQLNPAAFMPALAGQNGNVPQNFFRGFGENQLNLTLRKTFPIYERLNLQFKAEEFNILNHTNFGSVDAVLGDPTFGQATNSLASGLGGLSAQYQTGGPRSQQLSLKLVF